MPKLIYRSDGRRSPKLYPPTLHDWFIDHPKITVLVWVAFMILSFQLVSDFDAKPVQTHPWEHIGENRK